MSLEVVRSVDEAHATIVVVADGAVSDERSAEVLVVERKADRRRVLISACPADGGAEQARAWARRAAQNIAAYAGDSRVAFDFTGLPEHRLQPAVEGLLDIWGELPSTADLALVLDPASEPMVRRAELVQRSVSMTRGIVDARANQCTPPGFAAHAERIAQEHGLGIRTYGEDQLRDLGMGGLLAVGSGSAEPSMLVELWYTPGARPASEPAPGSVAMIGKGITFDSGGLSLKSPTAQVGMHTDKAGAATVLGVMAGLRALGVTVPVHAVLPLAENMPGPTAVKPGDVVSMRNGVGVEVVDTDFEGRLIMADALAWASEWSPQAVLDVATLTYQVIIALGPSIGGVVARDPGFGRLVLEAAERGGESMWGLPWAPVYAPQIRSEAPGATLKNHPGADSGRALSAALFLGEFVPIGVPWVHLDVAGPAVAGVGAGTKATGFGVRTLLELLSGWSDGLSGLGTVEN